MAYKYATNCEVHMNNWSTFLDRTIKAFLATQGEDTNHPLFKVLRKVITDSRWTSYDGYNYPGIFFDAEDVDFLSYMQTYFLIYSSDNYELDDDFVTSNLKIIPYLFVHMLKYIEKVGEDYDIHVEKFHCLPMHNFGRKSIPIQGKTLYHIMKSVVFNGGEVFKFANGSGGKVGREGFGPVREYYWRLLFDVQRYERPMQGLKFNHSQGASTNGVKCILHLEKTVTVEEEDDRPQRTLLDDKDDEIPPPLSQELIEQLANETLDLMICEGETIELDDDEMDDIIIKEMPIEINGESKYVCVI